MGEGSSRGSGRVRLLVSNRGSGRVNVLPGRVGSGPRKVTVDNSAWYQYKTNLDMKMRVIIERNESAYVARTFEYVLHFVRCVTVTVSPNQIIIIIIIIICALNGAAQWPCVSFSFSRCSYVRAQGAPRSTRSITEFQVRDPQFF